MNKELTDKKERISLIELSMKMLNCLSSLLKILLIRYALHFNISNNLR